MSVAFAAAGVVAVLAVVLAFKLTGGNGNGSVSSAPTTPNTSALIGVQTGPAPWNPGLDHLPDRIQPLGLTEIGGEGQGVVLHIHAHLDIYVNGKKETVPGGIGIYNTAGGFLTELHTHDATGVIHIESPTKRQFSLGEFLGVWGVRFTDKCVGGYCKLKTPWRVYVNGLNYPGNPVDLILKAHQEIAIVIGSRPRTVPSTYNFGGL